MQGVAWRKLGKRLIYHSWETKCPKLDEIAQQHRSDDSRLRDVIECWLQGEGLVDKEPTWRRIIWALDDAPGTGIVADTIRHFAEPPPGKSCDSITFLYSV